MENILEVSGISKRYKLRSNNRSDKTFVEAVRNVSFYVRRKEVFGLVGKSGCGKTTLAKIITQIERPDEGRVELRGVYDIVFQDPFGSLNPRMDVLEIVGESLFVKGVRGKELKSKVCEMLEMVRLPADVVRKFPHQFSGGERQRIAIARALIRRPDLLVLDEPVSSLDVSIQAGILNLLKDLQEELDLSMVFVSHDLRVVEFISDIVAVMKDGNIVERGKSDKIYSEAACQYTRDLLKVIPKF